MEMPYKTVIVANGAFPTGNVALTMLRQSERLVACDGAADKLTAAGFTPTVVVGDLDSMRPESRTRWQHCLHHDPSKEYNDLQKALKYCISQQLDHIALLGCAGLRDDHFIANISIMATYSQWLDLVMVTDYGIFNALRQTTTLPSVPGQQVSVFTKDKKLPLTFHGLKYPVNNRCFHHLWEGSLNEATGDTFTIEMHGKGVVVVYRSLELRGVKELRS